MTAGGICASFSVVERAQTVGCATEWPARNPPPDVQAGWKETACRRDRLSSARAGAWAVFQGQVPEESKMRSNLFIGICVAATVVASANAGLPVNYVNALGASAGWYSDDTRNTSGTVLNGSVSSYQPYFGGFVPPSAANDAAIAQQIYFTDTGSATSGGDGVMVLDGTTSNSGKSSVKYYAAAGNPGGLGSGASLSSFTSTYRWFMDNYTTARTPALSLLIQGSNGLVYSMA
ncbi:MAG: hypothetical protein RIR10_1842, partial [Planctomycetota bacterium]